MIDKKIKAAWVGALRSGKYAQGKKYLRNGDKFCCLGVLCDIGEKKDWRKIGFTTYWQYAPTDYSEGIHYLPIEIRNIVKLSDVEEKQLAHMNDKGKTFKEIARWIQRNL